MVNRLTHILMSIGLACFAGIAAAHGGNPGVLAVLASAEGDPSALRLDEGIALRRADGWHYLCPALWDDDLPGPVAAPAAGPIVIAAASGIHLLDPASGAVRVHPDPDATTGRTLALRDDGERVLQLRVEGDLTRVVEIRPTSSRVLYGGLEAWQGIDATADAIVLARVAASRVELLTLGPEGDERTRASAFAPEDALSATPRLVDDRAYLILLVDGGLSAELGRIERDAWVSLHRSGGGIAGPLLATDGSMHLAAGGTLARFDDEQLVATEEEAIVSCLSRRGAHSFACADLGLRALDGQGGLGDVLFDLSELLPPDPGMVPETKTDACHLQWLRYGLDLRAVGIEPPTALQSTPPKADAGPAPDGGAPADDAGRESAVAGDAGAGPRGDTEAASASPGCSAGRRSRSASPGWALAGACLALLWWGRRRASRRARQLAGSASRASIRAATDRKRHTSSRSAK